MPMLSSVSKAHIQLLIYALLISTSFPLANFLGSQYSPLLTTWLRFALAALGFVCLLRWQGLLQWPGWQAIGRYSLISLPLTGFFLLMFIAGKSASALAMGSLATLVPLFSALLAWMFWRQSPQPSRLLALVAGALGALWVLTGGKLSQLGQGGWPPGNTHFLMACLLMGIYPLVLKVLHRGESMLKVTGWSLITGTGWLTLAALLWQPPLALPNSAQWMAIIWLAVATTMVTFFLFQSAALVVGGSSANAYSLLTPAFVLLLNLAMGGHSPGWGVLPGLVLTVLALIWLLLQDRAIREEQA
ncbi:DMT family transporter [Ferrimonas balearica]|uniref:DMT family transporter n=1 Tax=Ferrimonas balearica TaxID=44012 RepID=UPI001C994F59|nr:DMT family transporter [Ferrimonas balearica]MBY5923451.1 DMT family transporter [Ferrimonas balearica]MBY5997830.1 DMT family transporter [Ferrimonas balearica]